MDALILSVLFLSLSSCAPQAKDAPLDPTELNRVTKMQGEWDAQLGVYKLAVIRSGIPLHIHNHQLPSAMTLGASATLTGTRNHAVVLGDLPVLQDELNPFLQNILHLGLQVTAVHNRFLWDDPRVLSVHFQGAGPAEHLIAASAELLQKLQPTTIPGTHPGSLNVDLVDQILWKGKWADGVYKITTGKGSQIEGKDLPDAMEVNSWMAFTGTAEHATANGDIAMLESELRPVLEKLTQGHIQIVSLHTHMTQETPRLLFVHFWAEGKLSDIVWGLKHALEEEKSFRGST